MNNRPTHVLLIGGGHAHLAVLADWIRHGLPAQKATLLTPHPTLRYSGMVPGWISGQYDRDAGLVDVAALARKAGVQLVLDRCSELNPDQRRAISAGGERIDFDIASIDTGGVGRAIDILGEDPRIIDIRPIDAFVDALAKWRHEERKEATVAVIGGGAGGVELALALRNLADGRDDLEIVFVTGSDGLLPALSTAVRRKVAGELERQGVSITEKNASLRNGELMAGEHTLEPVDLIVTALGSAAPAWPRESGLDCDEDGFIAVDRYQRSTSHPHILAVGDVAARQDREVPHSGVHAVFAGPVLAKNLRDASRGEKPVSVYKPRRNSLYLMSTGNGSAIASYGSLTAKGRWVGILKDWIDTRWIAKYARLAKGM